MSASVTVHAGNGGTLSEISEDVVVGEAQVVASRLVGWFRERLLTAEAQRDAADEARLSAEDDRRVADSQRDTAVDARLSAEKREQRKERLGVRGAGSADVAPQDSADNLRYVT